MPPNTRSSANNTPTRNTAAARAAPSSPSPASPSPRKVYHCKTCGETRRGHPRQGCPKVPKQDDATETEESIASTETDYENYNAQGSGDTVVANAFGNLKIESPPTPRRRINTETATALPIHPDTPSDRRRHRASLGPSPPQPLGRSPTILSLTVSEQRLADGMTTRGQFSQDVNEDPRDRVNNWVRGTMTVAARNEFVPLSNAPRTLSASSSMAPTELDIPSPRRRPARPEARVVASPSSSSAVTSSTSTSTVPSLATLTRRMSASEQTLFLEELSTNRSSVHIQILAPEDLDEIIARASEARLFTRAITQPSGPAMLIVGRSEDEVVAVADAMSPPERSSGGSRLRAGAGGFVAGAVGMWGGLAIY